MRAKRGLAPLPENEEPVEEDDTVGKLPPHLYWIWEAFTLLSRTRVVNQTGPQPIIPSEILAHCEIIGIHEWESLRNELYYLVNALDTEWMKRSHAQIHKSREDAKKEAEKQSRNKRGRRGR